MSLFYDRYWSSRPGGGDFQTKWPAIVKYVPNSGGVILEFGCGKGKLIEAMMGINPSARYIGVDVSQVALDFAEHKFPSVEFHRVDDGGPIPLPDKSVDFIMASEVIEHVYDTQQTFSELSRVLKPQGRILVTTPYHGIVKDVLIALFDFDSHFDTQGAHIRFFTKKSLLSNLARAGLAAIDCGYYGRFFPISHCIAVLAGKSPN
jgi:ubiquinone/menaquinone biosynthesis C-methylase UbiE